MNMTTDKANEERERELLAYLRGEMTEEEAASFRARIAADELYAERLEELLLGSGGQEERETDVLSEETQRAILRRSKWRHRLGNAAYTVGISLLVGAVLMFANGWIGWYLHEDAYRVARDMVHFTQPGLTVGSSGSQIGFLYGEINMELREQVGGDDQNAGTFSISNVFSIISAKPAWTDGLRKERLFFLFPSSAADREESAFRRNSAWNTLEKLPEGTVAQLAVSFDRLLTHDEYYALLSGYDLDTTWFAVDTGQERNHPDAAEGSLLLSAGDVWGYAERELDYGEAPIQAHGEGERRARAYLAEMEYLAGQERLTNAIGERLVTAGNRLRIEERCRYLQQNGVRLYGAVVTGPVKELLKLRQEPSITAAFVGRIDWWNWDRPSASGQRTSP
jgi:hypothetical protein